MSGLEDIPGDSNVEFIFVSIARCEQFWFLERFAIALSALSQDRPRWQTLTEAEHLVQVLGTTMGVFQSAHNAEELFASAIR